MIAAVTPPAARPNGFTLVELLVSLLIFSMLAAAGVGLLGFSVRAQEAAGDTLDSVAALRRLGAVMTADLAQATPRLVRDEGGQRVQAFTGGIIGDEGASLIFVRQGWSNSTEAPRASLQRVRYRLVGDRLERTVWPMLDGAAPGRPAALMTGASNLRLRYRTRGEWRDQWDPQRLDAMPDAVELVFDLAGTGPVRQLFLVGGGGQ